MIRSIYGMSFLTTLVCILIGCDLDRVNLDQEYLPNYSLTLNSLPVSANTTSKVIVLDDTKYLLAVQRPSSEIELYDITQSAVDDEWELTPSLKTKLGDGSIRFFDVCSFGYLIGYMDENEIFVTKIINEDFDIVRSLANFLPFIDTFYNSVDLVDFRNFTPVSDGYLLVGEVFTQGTNYSCILKVDQNLDPVWFKTYFEFGVIQDVTSVGIDSFYILQNTSTGADLIFDNKEGSIYKKFGLSTNQLFFGMESVLADSILHLSGIENEIARTIEINLSTQIAFINDIEIYPVSDFRSLVDSDENIVTTGLQTTNGAEVLFASELGPNGSNWCNSYPTQSFDKILDLVRLPIRGILIASLVTNNGNYFINFTRIDNEGATIPNQYTENCL